MRYLWKKSLFLLLLAFTSCGKSDGGDDASNVEGIVSEFTGLASLTQSDDNSWIVRWFPLDLDGVVYAVYSAAEGEPFNYDQPIVTTPEDIYKYTPENIFEENSRCFAVRVSNFNGDTNESSQCTSSTPFVFSGITSIERLSDGAYQIQWDSIPLKGTIYAVYDSKDKEPYNFDLPSFDAIKDNFFKTNVLERGAEYCYIVRYFNSKLPADTNTSEFCSEKEDTIDFVGISGLVALSPTSVSLSWELSKTEGITTYQIYQGSDFKEKMVSVSAEKTSATILGLVPGRQYSFGVRAVDQYHREDSNLKIRPIVMPVTE